MTRASETISENKAPEAKPRSERRRRMKRWRRRVGHRLVKWFGPTLLGFWSRSWRMRVLGQEHLDHATEKAGGHFMSLWHGRMVLGLPYFSKTNWHVLVSPSSDGDVSEELLRGFGYHVIRGSSSRGGARALREMLEVLQAGSVLAITPDGPRGPRHSMNPGLAWMAKATGYPIVPCGFVCDRGWRMKSWDRFLIPKFRARVVISFGEPVWVERKADEEDQARATETIRQRMIAAEELAFDELDLEPDW